MSRRSQDFSTPATLQHYIVNTAGRKRERIETGVSQSRNAKSRESPRDSWRNPYRRPQLLRLPVAGIKGPKARRKSKQRKTPVLWAGPEVLPIKRGGNKRNTVEISLLLRGLSLDKYRLASVAHTHTHTPIHARRVSRCRARFRRDRDECALIELLLSFFYSVPCHFSLFLFLFFFFFFFFCSKESEEIVCAYVYMCVCVCVCSRVSKSGTHAPRGWKIVGKRWIIREDLDERLIRGDVTLDLTLRCLICFACNRSVRVAGRWPRLRSSNGATCVPQFDSLS